MQPTCGDAMHDYASRTTAIWPLATVGHRFFKTTLTHTEAHSMRNAVWMNAVHVKWPPPDGQWLW
jgi:hypothetical protein